jgi:hypothetical protein
VGKIQHGHEARTCSKDVQHRHVNATGKCSVDMVLLRVGGITWTLYTTLQELKTLVMSAYGLGSETLKTSSANENMLHVKYSVCKFEIFFVCPLIQRISGGEIFFISLMQIR